MICPTNCPCGPNEMSCPGAPAMNGRPAMDTCMEAKIGECVAFCPVHCGEGQVHCPAPPMPNGCPQADSCADAAAGCPAM